MCRRHAGATVAQPAIIDRERQHPDGHGQRKEEGLPENRPLAFGSEPCPFASRTPVQEWDQRQSNDHDDRDQEAASKRGCQGALKFVETTEVVRP